MNAKPVHVVMDSNTMTMLFLSAPSQRVFAKNERYSFALGYSTTLRIGYTIRNTVAVATRKNTTKNTGSVLSLVQTLCI
jgi:hypothetical protein